MIPALAPRPHKPHGASSSRRALQRDRVRRYRQRQRNGGAVLQIQVADYNALCAVLIDAEWLTEAEALDRRQVEAKVSAALAELAVWGAKGGGKS
jgi:hypothetical protein